MNEDTINNIIIKIETAIIGFFRATFDLIDLFDIKNGWFSSIPLPLVIPFPLVIPS